MFDPTQLQRVADTQYHERLARAQRDGYGAAYRPSAFAARLRNLIGAIMRRPAAPAARGADHDGVVVSRRVEV